MREDLINSAVQFLNDPAVASSTLAKRVEFLESKQLAPDEIEEALKRAQQHQTAGGSTSGTTAHHNPLPPPQPSRMLQPAPPVPERDWKDYFVMATVSVGVAYGIYEVAKRYVLPMILPPTPPALEADKIALDQEFTRMEALVEQLTNDTTQVVEAEGQRAETFNSFMVEARDALDRIKTQSSERRQETKLALATIEQLKEQLPRSLKQYGDQQQLAVTELQSELKSLKQLVSNRMNRGPSSIVPPASSVPSTLPSFVKKPNGTGSTPGTGPSTPQLNEPSTSASPQSTNSTPGATPAPAAKETEAKEESFIPIPAGASSSTSGAAGAANAAAAATPIPNAAMGIPAWQLAAQGKS